MVGTAMNNVRSPLPKRFQIASASARGSISQEAPAHSAQPSTLTTPCV